MDSVDKKCPVCKLELPWLADGDEPTAHDCPCWDYHWDGRFQTGWMKDKNIQPIDSAHERVPEEGKAEWEHRLWERVRLQRVRLQRDSLISIVDAIRFKLDGTEWSADTLDAIADILRNAGFTIRDKE